MANNPYTNKVIFGNTTVMDITDTTAEEADVASGKTFYKASGAKSVGTGTGGSGIPEEELRDTVGWTCKNLIDNTNGTQTVTGVTFTVNSDNSVTVTGTPDSGTNPRYEVTRLSFPVGTYVLSGKDDSLSDQSWGFIGVIKNNTGDYVCRTDSGNQILEVTSTSDYYIFYIRMADGHTYNNTFRPMLRKASITDSTYEPYHKSVDYVKANREEVEDVVGWSGKNLLENVNGSGSENGVTAVKNTDGTISLSGTASANTFISISDWFDLPAGEYILSGSVSNKVYVYIQKQISGGTETVAECRVAYPDGVLFSWDGSANVRVRLVVENGENVNSKTIYPMLRKADIADPTYEPYHVSVKQTLRDGEVIEGKNLLDYDTYEGKVVTVNGEIQDDPDCRLSDYIEMKGNQVIFSSDSKTGSPYWRIAFYTDAKEFIERPSGQDGTHTVDVPSNAKYARVCLTKSSVAYFTNPMLRYATEADSTYEPYYIPLKDSKFDRAEQRVLGAKNLFCLDNIRSGADDCTISQDGKVIRIANSTAGTYKQTNFDVAVSANTNYVITSDASVTSGKGRIAVSNADNTETIVNSSNITTNTSVSLAFNSGNNSTVIIKLACTLGDSELGDVTYTNAMLRLASDPDNTYVPYAKTNKELTDEIATKQDTLTFDTTPTASSTNPVTSGGVKTALDAKYNRSEANVLGAKNILINQAFTQTITGIKYVANDDGSISVASGQTASGYSNMQLTQSTVLPAGTYVLSGCPSGGDSNTYRLRLVKNGTLEDIDSGSGYTFTANGTDAYLVTVAIGASGGTYTVPSNLLFKPMIRLASDPDATYQTPAMSNRMLTERSPDFDYNPHNLIPSNADLNNYKTPGFYRVASGTIAATLSNSPITTEAFGMKVFLNNPTGSFITQKIEYSTSNQIYIRRFASNAWGSWQKISLDTKTLHYNTIATQSITTSTTWGDGITALKTKIDALSLTNDRVKRCILVWGAYSPFQPSYINVTNHLSFAQNSYDGTRVIIDLYAGTRKSYAANGTMTDQTNTKPATGSSLSLQELVYE